MKKILYHFSDYDFKILKPDFFGKNSYTKNDLKFPLKRFFAYDVKKPLEYIFKASSFVYSFSLPENKIYNLETDILKIKEKFNYDIDLILEYLSKKFVCVSYLTSFKTYVIFKSIKPLSKEKRF